MNTPSLPRPASARNGYAPARVSLVAWCVGTRIRLSTRILRAGPGVARRSSSRWTVVPSAALSRLAISLVRLRKRWRRPCGSVTTRSSCRLPILLVHLSCKGQRGGEKCLSLLPLQPPCLAAPLDGSTLHLRNGGLELVLVSSGDAQQSGEPDVGVAADDRAFTVEHVAEFLPVGEVGRQRRSGPSAPSRSSPPPWPAGWPA